MSRIWKPKCQFYNRHFDAKYLVLLNQAQLWEFKGNVFTLWTELASQALINYSIKRSNSHISWRSVYKTQMPKCHLGPLYTATVIKCTWRQYLEVRVWERSQKEEEEEKKTNNFGFLPFATLGSHNLFHIVFSIKSCHLNGASHINTHPGAGFHELHDKTLTACIVRVDSTTNLQDNQLTESHIGLQCLRVRRLEGRMLGNVETWGLHFAQTITPNANSTSAVAIHCIHRCYYK